MTADLADMLDIKKNDRDLMELRHEKNHSYCRSKESSSLIELNLAQTTSLRAVETSKQQAAVEMTSDTMTARQPPALE